MALTYRDKLKDPRWQRVRLNVWDRAGDCCESCGNSRKQLDVHHFYYERGLDPWDYPLESLALLCQDCHESWHARKAKIDKLLARTSTLDLDRIIGLMEGALSAWNTTDRYIDKGTDALVVVGVIRGFWTPPEITQLMIDTSLLWLAHGKSFCLSELVKECVPMDEPKYGFIRRWFEDATKDGER